MHGPKRGSPAPVGTGLRPWPYEDWKHCRAQGGSCCFRPLDVGHARRDEFGKNRLGVARGSQCSFLMQNVDGYGTR